MIQPNKFQRELSDTFVEKRGTLAAMNHLFGSIFGDNDAEYKPRYKYNKLYATIYE